MNTIKTSLKNQYGSCFAMLRQAVERCPDDLWLGGEHPRNTWRIAYHAAYYTHLYIAQSSKSFESWVNHRKDCVILWDKPKVEEPYTKAEVLDYIDFVVDLMPSAVENLNLEAKSSGYSWYPNVPKVEHQFVNLRHIQGHVGQLSELLMARGINIDWVG
jgi:hypothetical protein